MSFKLELERALARRLKVDVSTVRRWLSGKAEPRESMRLKVLALLSGQKDKIIFIDGIDWAHHLGKGADPKGARVYNTVDDTLSNQPCAKECGVAKCRLVFDRWSVTPKPR